MSSMNVRLGVPVSFSNVSPTKKYVCVVSTVSSACSLIELYEMKVGGRYPVQVRSAHDQRTLSF